LSPSAPCHPPSRDTPEPAVSAVPLGPRHTHARLHSPHCPYCEAIASQSLNAPPSPLSGPRPVTPLPVHPSPIPSLITSSPHRIIRPVRHAIQQRNRRRQHALLLDRQLALYGLMQPARAADPPAAH